MRRTILRPLAAMAIVLAFGRAPAMAQTGQMFGELVGKVTDDQGGVLPGVAVTLSGPAVMGTPTVTTNASGLYRFPAVNNGTYTLKFEITGFAPLVREGIIVPVRQTVTVDASMKIATLQETVTVSGSSPTVDVENTKVGARLDHEILQAVPTSRTIFGSTTVLPGMTMARQDPGGLNAATSTGMVAHGASNYNLNYYGVTADTPANYGSMYYMDFGSAEEISVDTAAMGAEIGGGGGANINVVPKSGGNTVKGEVIESITGKGYWDGFTASNITPDLRAQGITDPTLRKLNDFNANAGGPFVKDRLWWFGSFRNYKTVEVTTQLHDREQRRQPDEPVRLTAEELHGEHQVPDQQEQPAVRVLDLQQKVPAAPRGGYHAAAPRRHAETAVAEEPLQRQLDVGHGPEHVPGSVIELLPHALAKHVVRRVQRAACVPTALVDVQHRHRHLHRRSGADRPAVPRFVPAADQRRAHALHRRLPRRKPSVEDRLRKLVGLGIGWLRDLQ